MDRWHARPLLKRQAGLSIIELMIAIAIGLFLLVGLVSVFAASSRAYLEHARAAQQIENGRFATQLLVDDVGLAGFYGQYPGAMSAPGALPDPCEVLNMADLRAALALPVQGYNNPPAPPAPVSACVSNANHVPGTDILVIRRADSRTTALAALAAPEVYLQANASPADPGNPIVASGSAGNFTLTDRLGAAPAPVRKYHVHIFFVAPCSIPNGGGAVCTGAADDGGRPIPTLKRLELALDPADNTLKMRLASLVEGIEHLQIDYALDTDSDGAPNGAYIEEPATPADWANVVAVRVNVLARNLEPGAETDTKVYDMGAAGTLTSTAGGGTLDPAYKRHVYNAVVRVVNPGARRETP